jgi:hypothetical protein
VTALLAEERSATGRQGTLGQRRRRCSDTHDQEVLRQRGGGAASDNGGFKPAMALALQTAVRSAGAFMARARRVAVSARHGERG